MKECNYNIDILLATFNGSKFLDEQLSSIENQTYQLWRLIIRDDGSNDNTIEIINKWKNKLGERMVILENESKRLGAIGNFEKLLNYSNAEYIAFCDQDDVWKNNKLEIFIKRMKLLANEAKYDKPILIYSDLEIVDMNLKAISKSFWEYEKIDPKIALNKNDLAISNCITGCAMMINKRAKECSLPIGPDAAMHDWWIGLSVKCADGILCSINEKTVLYRQHGSNAVGAQKENSLVWAKKMINAIFGRSESIKKCYRQAKHFGLAKNYLLFIIRKILLIFRREFKYI